MVTWLKRKWTVLGILATAWVVFTTVYALSLVTVPEGSTKLFETVKFVALSVSAFGVLFSSLLASFNSLEATANVQDRIRFDRIENSFEFARRWESPVLREARDWTRRIAKQQQSLSPDDLRRKIREDEALERSVITMFNFFEEMEMSIRYARVDDAVLRRGFGQIYGNVYRRFLPWIETDMDRDQQTDLKSLLQRWSGGPGQSAA